MFSVMRHVENFTAFYRSLRGHSVEHQRELVKAIVARMGGRIIAEYTADEHGGDRDEWIRTTRQHEGAVVAGLYVIPEPATKGRRPSADYAAALMSLVQRCAVVVDAESGLTSRDGAKWVALVERHAHKTAAGRTMHRKRAQKMAKAKWDKAPPTPSERWSAPNMKREHKRWAQHWRDPIYSTAQAAFDALPEAMQAEIKTTRRMYDIFGPRDPTGARGGRPPAAKKRKR